MTKKHVELEADERLLVWRALTERARALRCADLPSTFDDPLHDRLSAILLEEIAAFEDIAHKFEE